MKRKFLVDLSYCVCVEVETSKDHDHLTDEQLENLIPDIKKQLLARINNMR